MGLLSFLGGLVGLGGTPNRKIEVQKRSAAEGLPIIYGQRRAEPIAVFKVVSRSNMPITNAAAYDHVYNPQPNHEYEEYRDQNDWLNRIDVWGQGEISEVRKFWIDGDPHTASRFNARPYFRGMSKYGTETQTAASELVSGHPDWTSSHKGQGVAYTWSRFYNSKKKPQFDAEPELNALVKGIRVYDPREASQSASDSSTWGYSDNRALIVLNYLMSSYGLNAPDADIDFDSFADAADACDETMDIPVRATNATGQSILDYWDRWYGTFVTIPDGAYFPDYRVDQAGTTQAQYTADAILDPKDGVVRNVKKLLEGFGWSLPWSNGKHRLILEGVVAAPVMSFDEDSIIGGWTVERGMRSDRLNRVTVEFPNANKDYKEDSVSWPEINSTQHTTYKTEDQGQDLHTNITLDTVTDFYRAQAFAEFMVRKSRVSPRITGLQLAPKAILLEPGDVIEINYIDKGFNGTWFIVEAISISPDLEVSVDLLKYDPTVYGAPAMIEEPLGNSPYNPDLWLDPPALSDLELAANYETNADGSVISGITASWSLPVGGASIASIEVSWKKSTDTDYATSMLLTGTSTSASIAGLVDSVSYDVRVEYTTQRGLTADAAEATINLVGIPSKLDTIEEGATRTVHRGEYSDTTTYSKGDVVTYLGSSYMFTANAATSGVEPDDETYWSLLSAQGPQGVPGPAGADGQPRYLWIAYASNSTGTQNFTTGSPTSVHSYFGTAANKTTATEGTNPAAYTWKQLPSGMTEQEIVDALGWGQNAVDTDYIVPGAVTNSNQVTTWGDSPFFLALPLNDEQQKGSISITGYNSSTDKLVILLFATIRIDGGKANIEMRIEDDNGVSKEGGFLTEQRHTVGSSEKYTPISFAFQFNGNVAMPVKAYFKATYLSTGVNVATAYVREVSMVAVRYKR